MNFKVKKLLSVLLVVFMTAAYAPFVYAEGGNDDAFEAINITYDNNEEEIDEEVNKESEEVIKDGSEEDGGEEEITPIYSDSLGSKDGRNPFFNRQISGGNEENALKGVFALNGKARLMTTALGVQETWDGETLTEPDKDEDGYYIISGPDELMWFNGNWDVNDKVRLTADITLNGSLEDEDTAYIWIPVGTSSKKFNGVFDGNGYTIKGLYINSTAANTGLIGYGDTNAVIKDLTIEGKVVSSKNYTGAFAGDFCGSIENCHNKAEIDGADYTGGVVGEHDKVATMTNCSNEGKVSGGKYVGGLAGRVYSSSSNAVTSSFNRGDVSGRQWAGGITGSVYSGGVLTDVYSRCNVEATSSSNGYVGGLIGEFRSGTVINAYAAGTVASAAAGNSCGGVAGSLSFANGAKTLSNVSYAESMGDTTGDLKGCTIQNDEAEALSDNELKALADDLGSGFTDDSENINEGYPVLSWENEGGGGSDEPDDEWEAVKPEIKNGIYQITTAAELKWAADYINKGNTDISIILLNDIDTEERIWEPIDSFDGVFDGGGFTVDIKIESSKAGAAVFKTNNGTIKNLKVSGTVKGGDYCAAIAAYNNGTIENCVNTADVEGGNHTAGIAAQNGVNKGAEGNIVFCSNSGSVAGLSYTGGIAADNINGTVNKCSNSGFIKGTAMVGGVLASNESELEGCFNTGLVVSTAKVFRANTGGVIGWQNGTAENIYNTGSIIGAGGHIGGCIGLPTSDTLSKNLYGTGWVMGMYYDDGDSYELYYVGGAAGKESRYVENAYYLNTLNGAGAGEAKDEAYLKSREFVSALGEGFKEDTVNGGYPVLSWQNGDNTPEYKTDLTGNVEVTGTAEPDSVLTASYSGNGENPIYVWYKADDYGEYVLSVDTNTYKATAEDTGSVIYVKVFDKDWGGFVSGKTDGIISGMEGSVKITGAAVVGRSLTAEYTGSEESPVYKWYRGNTEIAEGESYTLTDADAGYTIKVRVYGNKSGYIEEILHKTVKTAEEAGVWSKDKCSEPSNADGIYCITKEKELYWFVSEVNCGNTEINGKLINDITLTEDSFIPIGGDENPYEGTFDGNGKTVYGLKIDTDKGSVGFFGAVGGKGVVKSLGVDGNINASGENADSVGGIVGFTEGKITDCSFGGTVNGHNNVGGIAGITGLNGKIYRCENKAEVMGGERVGGISGGVSCGEIYFCANTGNVGGSRYVGGIAGEAVNYAEITGCYSTGNIEGNSYTGGIAGKLYSSCAPQGCYAAGSVKGGAYTGAVTGCIDGTDYIALVTGSFYNNKLPADNTAKAMAEEDMKKSSFVSELNLEAADTCFSGDSKKINDGYPVLLWQKSRKTEGGSSLPEDGYKKKIKVSFTLIGDIAHGSDEHSGGETVWIDNITVKDLPEGTTAYDVFKSVLIENGFTFKATGAGYITSITNPEGVTLAEFTNGPRSGWMYTVNNAFPDYMDSCILKNGDDIVVFYVDDYMEIDWDSFGDTSSGKNNGGGAEVKNELLNRLTEEEGTVKAVIDGELAAAESAKALASGKKNIEVDISGKEEANRVVLSITKEAIDEIIKNPGIGISLKTPYGEISLSGESLKNITGNAEIILEKTENGVKVDIPDTEAAVILPAGDFNTAYITDENGNKEEIRFSAVIDGLMCIVTDKSGKISLESYKNIFDDVENGAWYADDVDFICGRNIMSGIGNNLFGPNMPVTRGMFAAMLYRLEGEPETVGENRFTDVKETDYCYKAVIWAADNGIVSGTSENTFSPNDVITREQMAVMLKNYGDKYGVGLIGTDFSDIYDDFGEVSPWAEDAVNWVVENGIISGRDENLLVPKGTATRAESAAVLRRLIEVIISNRI